MPNTKILYQLRYTRKVELQAHLKETNKCSYVIFNTSFNVFFKC